MTTSVPAVLPAPRRSRLSQVGSLAVPFALATLVASAAYAGADTTFTPALQKFTVFPGRTVGDNRDGGDGRTALGSAGFGIAGDTANEDDEIGHGSSPD